MTIDDILNGDEGKFAYLFPYRDRVPKIEEHIFSGLRQSKQPIDEYLVSTMLNTDYLGWTAKVLLNIDLFPIQIAILQILWRTTFPMLIACRGGGKSYLLAVYAVLRAVLDPGSKIVIVGAGLRQAKLVFSYVEEIWNNSPVLRNIIGGGKKSGPRQNVDLCYFRVGDSIIHALPLGDGCASKNTLTLYDDRFGTISDDQTPGQTHKTIVNRYKKIWGNEKFRLSDESYCNGKSKTKKIKTHHGFEFDATPNHKLKTVRNQQIKWTRMDEIQIGDRILLDRSVRWHSGSTDVTEEQSYALGLLIGDGSYTLPYRIGFSTCDIELVHAVQKLIPIKQHKNDPMHWSLSSKPQRTKLLKKFGIYHYKTKNKRFPDSILKSSREVTSAFISGLFDTDGHVQVQDSKRGIGITIGFTNTSKELVRQLQYILLHYGIVAHVSSRKRDKNWEECYELLITGRDVLIFATEIGFRLRRKQDKLFEGIEKKKRWMDQGDDIPDVLEDMIDISENNRAKHNMGNCVSVCAGRLKVKKSISRSLVKNFLDVYGQIDDSRIDSIRNLANPNIYYDEIVSIEDSECVTFDVHVPDGHEYCANGFYSHNTKIRGFRANVVIADEFASIPPDVFDIVVRGFAATAKTPVESARQKAINKKLKKIGISLDITKELSGQKVKGNQIIYSGTAYYEFNHFAKKFETWRDIIRSKGDPQEVARIFGGHNMVPDDFDTRDYAVIRIPHDQLPDGLLDVKQLAHAKAILPKYIYMMEYGAVFVKDSDGFFPRSLIERCTCFPGRPILTSDGDAMFDPMMKGVQGRKYVMGIDPAAERDNLAVVVIEVWMNHYRVVHCWAVNKEEFEKRKEIGYITHRDYYEYCCYKIREIYKLFRPVRIEMDSQGGGYPISEMLRNKKLLNKDDGDFPIYEIIDPENPKETDGESDGPQILSLVKQSSEFNAQANLCLHKSFETQRLLFPSFNTAIMESARIAEEAQNVQFDRYHENVDNIEILKNELCTIHMSETSTGKERFDTPTVILPGSVEGRQRKGRLRKDRYTALLLAHKYVYESDITPESNIDYTDSVGNIKKIKKLKKGEAMYFGLGIVGVKDKGPKPNTYKATQNGEVF
jgi:intein/homing endonuclease